MKKSLSTILVFLNLLVSPWLGCYANSKDSITASTAISYVENKKDNRAEIEEKTIVAVNKVSPVDYIHSESNNVFNVVLKNGKTLKIAMDSDVKVVIPKLKEQLETILKKQHSKVKKKVKNNMR